MESRRCRSFGCSSPIRSAIRSSKRKTSDRPTSRSRFRAAPRTRSRKRNGSPSSSVIRLTRKRPRAEAAGSRKARAGSWSRRSIGRPPPEWGVGAHLKHLKNSMCTSGAGQRGKFLAPATTQPRAIPTKTKEGIVCFITVAGFLNGPGFREDARRSAAHVLRNLGRRLLSGRASARSRQPAFSKQYNNRSVSFSPHASLARATEQPAPLQFLALAKGHVKKNSSELKQAVAGRICSWVECPSGWREPFLPAGGRRMGNIRCHHPIYLYMTVPGLCPDALGSLLPTWRR